MSRFLNTVLLAAWISLVAGKAARSEEGLGKLIVHEWGTFTTFSGSDGVHLDFRPLQDSELPHFVLNRASQSGYLWLGKGHLKTRVRMETPVTYFYTPVPRKVRVSVEFPQGLLTEFYPPVVSQSPKFNSKLGMGTEGEPVGKGKLDWGEVDLLPISSLKPDIDDPQVAEMIARHVDRTLPPSAAGSHYEAARATDSAMVHLHLPERKPLDGFPLPPPQGDYFEKFLFYRGVGKFDVPVKVENPTADRFVATNAGSLPIPRMLLLQVQGDALTYSWTAPVPAGQSIDLSQPLQVVELEQLRAIMTDELQQTGLYEKEARAMVNTWTSSWFREEGLRLFYLVPPQKTEEILPLRISPRPDEQLRVMVGRIEIMSTSQEAQLLQLVKQTAKERNRLQKIAAEAQTATELPPLPAELIQLGRFAEPALSRIRELAHEEAIRLEVDALLWQLKQLEKAPT